jgi:acyl dehydratase
MTITVPLTLAREQIPTIVTSFGVALRSMSPLTRPRRVPESPQAIEVGFSAPSRRLVDNYIAWSGAPEARYHDTLPPHFCSHWAFGLLARLGGQAPYNLASILNQGLRLQINAPIPRDTDLKLRGQLKSVNDDGQRIRIHSQVIAGWNEQPEAIIIDNYSAVPKRSANKKTPMPRVEPLYTTVGEWSVEADDGINFALLTGDFNPIHTVWPLARRTRYRGCILHGFGTTARTWETLRNAGYEFTDIDLRFIKPLPLPSSGLEVQVAPAAEGRQAFRLRSRDGSVHLAGSFAVT